MTRADEPRSAFQLTRTRGVPQLSDLQETDAAKNTSVGRNLVGLTLFNVWIPNVYSAEVSSTCTECSLGLAKAIREHMPQPNETAAAAKDLAVGIQKAYPFPAVQLFHFTSSIQVNRTVPGLVTSQIWRLTVQPVAFILMVVFLGMYFTFGNDDLRSDVAHTCQQLC